MFSYATPRAKLFISSYGGTFVTAALFGPGQQSVEIDNSRRAMNLFFVFAWESLLLQDNAIKNSFHDQATENIVGKTPIQLSYPQAL